jgi:hypothetical protein
MQDNIKSADLDMLLVQQAKSHRFILDPWPDLRCPTCEQYNVVFRVSTQEMLGHEKQKLTGNLNTDFEVRKYMDDNTGDFTNEKIERGFFCGNCKTPIDEETVKRVYFESQ